MMHVDPPSQSQQLPEISVDTMAQVQRPPEALSSFAHDLPGHPSLSLYDLPARTGRFPSGTFATGTFSPVNQNGSFEFDRVLKSGYVEKRTRKTKAWKPIYLVLRPNTLSIYKDDKEQQLRHKITLSDLTAVAFLKDPKQRQQHMFGLFSRARNYHLEAPTQKDSIEWVELIRKEARIEEEEEEMFLADTGSVLNTVKSALGLNHNSREERVSSLEISRTPYSPNIPIHPQSSRIFEYSGNELTSHSESSDIEAQNDAADSAMPIATSIPVIPEVPESSSSSLRPALPTRHTSQVSGHGPETDPERVVWQGYLLYLKSSHGVKQWKELWMVLRPRSMALYKDSSEYSPQLIVPLSSIINAVEIDAMSKSKQHCMQIITEERSYRFCAPTEEVLDKTLGAFKSLIAKVKRARTT